MNISKLCGSISQKPKNITFITLSRTICAKSFPKEKEDVSTKWISAVKEAEKVVGYPTSFLNLRWLLNDEIANVALHLRKLIGTNHPLLTTAKEHFFRNNNQAWGLVVLLISKTAGIRPEIPEIECDLNAGILHSQRVLAEVTEMIKTSIAVHKGLLNVKPGTEFEEDLLFGNKIALLSGDYLLSKSFHDLACLKNQAVNEIISSTLRDYTECEFLGTRDAQNNPLPDEPKILKDTGISDANNLDFGPYKVQDILGNSRDEWIVRTILGGGNLLGKSCQGTLLLGGHNQHLQEQGYLFGKHLALAWQAHLDYNNFVTKKDQSFSLVSAPVLLHLCKDISLYQEIYKGLENINDCDYKKIRRVIMQGTAIEDTKELYHEYARRAVNNLHQFENNSARLALQNIISSM